MLDQHFYNNDCYQDNHFENTFVFIKQVRIHHIVNLTVRVNPTKLESQQAKLEIYFLECVSKPLPLNSARTGARGRVDT